MRIVPSLILVAIGFSAGLAVAQYTSSRQPWVLPAEGPPVEVTPGLTDEGTKDPKADLEGQMMWDPNTHTYQGD